MKSNIFKNLILAVLLFMLLPLFTIAQCTINLNIKVCVDKEAVLHIKDKKMWWSPPPNGGQAPGQHPSCSSTGILLNNQAWGLWTDTVSIKNTQGCTYSSSSVTCREQCQTTQLPSALNNYETIYDFYDVVQGGAAVYEVNLSYSCPDPIVSLGNDTSLCPGKSTILDAGNSGSSYVWSTNETTQTINVSNSGPYSVTVTNDHGCTATGSININSLPGSTVNLGNDTSFCAGANITINSNSPGLSYSWSTSETTASINVSAPGFYAILVTNANGCTATDNINITQNSLPTVNLGNDTSICVGTSIPLNAGNSGSTYLWSTAETTQTISANSANTYSVIVTNALNCTASDSKTISTKAKPSINIGNDTALCAGKSITISGTALPSATYLWSTGATSQNITVNQTGLFFVDVTNNQGCVGRDTININLVSNPVVNIGVDSIICQGTSLILNAGNPGANYSWSTSATSQSIQISTAATYTVKVTDNNGCTGTDARTIAVSAQPIVDLGNDTTFCSPATLQLNAGTQGTSYLWSTNETSQKITANSSNKYSVTVTNGAGCSTKDTIQITVNPKPNVDLGKDTIVCQDIQVTFDAGNNGATYSWSNGSTTQSINLINVSGSYSVVVTNGFGCSDTDQVVMGIKPKQIVNLGKDTSFCEGKSITLDALNTGDIFLWNNGATSQKITITQSDTVWVTVTEQGCSKSDTIVIDVTPKPIVNLGSDQTVCFGTNTTLSAPAGSYIYSWSTNETTQNISILATSNNGYSVTVTDTKGCSNTDNISVSIYTLPAAYDDYATIKENEQLSSNLFYNDVYSGTTYSIYTQPSHGTLKPATNGQFSYQPNNGFNGNDMFVYVICDQTCPNVCDTATVYITILPDKTIKIPQGFSPNNDNINDVFVIEGALLYPENELIIYNRWGDVVYKASPYKNNWDGRSINSALKISGDELMEGTYFYQFKPDQKTDVLTGYVILKR